MGTYKYQGIHAILLGALLFATCWGWDVLGYGTDTDTPSHLPLWFWAAVLVAPIHQIYVVFAWRGELFHGLFTKWFGDRAFDMHMKFFFPLLVARVILMFTLAYFDRWSATLALPLYVGLLIFLTIMTVWTMASVKLFFTFRAAAGEDHFSADYRGKPLVKRGIFKYLQNAMYVGGFCAVWLPGVIFMSKAALLAAAFQHAYIWVHYFCTEKPDMAVIYGGGDGLA